MSEIAAVFAGVPGFDWVPGLIDHWLHLSLGGKVLEIVRLIFEIAGAWELFGNRLYGWLAKRRKQLEKMNEALEEEVRLLKQDLAKLRKDLAACTTELAEARDRLPGAAIARADREWGHKNPGLAIRHLEEWYDANADSMATIALHLAKFHLAEAIPTPGNHLTRASQMIHIARGASRDSQEAREMSIQFDLVNGALQEQLIRDAQIAWNDQVGREPGAVSLVQTLHNIAQYCYDRGHWRLAPIFAHRASEVAARGGVPLRKMWCEVEAFAAFLQRAVGHSDLALVRLDSVLATTERAGLDRDPVSLTAHFYRADTLSSLGCYADALREIEAFAPIQAEVLGARHANVLTTRWLRAQTLSTLGRYVDALREIEAFAPIRAEVLGARHPDVLGTRFLQAQTLSDLGRYADALREIEAFAPILAEVLGARHPNVLSTRYLRAQTLSDLGRYADALREIEAFAPIEAEVLGVRPSNVLTTESLRIGVRIASGADGNAANELPVLIAALAKSVGPHATQMLRARYRLARCLTIDGQIAEARTECHAILAAFDPAFDPNHELRRAVQTLLGRLDSGAGDGDLPT